MVNHLPGGLLYRWIFFRLMIQPIVAPTAMPAANVTATVSSECRLQAPLCVVKKFRSGVGAISRRAAEILSCRAAATADAARVALCVVSSICWPKCSNKQVGNAWCSLCTKLGKGAVRRDFQSRGKARRLRAVLRKTILQDCIEK